ncbi:alpha/beta hydrolase [Flavihumibacter profundi]|uniref:alpha/beta hydrolase n=1 Tax=Flavihumibacter profundi TaxID=2716883 RepID=UPI001CC43D1C|nr:alpha/beta hydrolase [Flavihumibacter profundi]MBZ5856758.1 alpha/beta hydrolase [Flavihumibacter profundi]
MLKLSFLSLALFSCVQLSLAQQKRVEQPKDILFPEIELKKNISYGVPAKKGIKKSYYLLDLYSPKTDSLQKRPLIIMMHGGGFKLGSKKSNSTPIFSKAFSQRGYVCASVNYRLSKKRTLSKYRDLAEGCFDAMADLNQVIAFFRKNMENYGIDTGRIILAGNSAGAMVALQAVYGNRRKMAQIIGLTGADSLIMPVLEQHISAIVNCWGAIFDSTWLFNARVPIVSIHGSKDRVVPIDYTDSTLFGSRVINRQSDAIGIPNKIKIYEGYDHELQRHFNPFFTGAAAKRRYRESASFICNFLSEQGLNPK